MVLYIVQTKMYISFIGGPGGTHLYGYSDGSFYTGTEFQSVGSYFVFASPLGGAVQSCTFETKYIVLSVMHVELDSITQLVNALMYATLACQEFNVHTPVTRRLNTDSEAAQSHCLDNSISKKSKHMEMKLQAVQIFQADDRIDVIHLAGPEFFFKHMVFTLGHHMMPGKGIEGVQEVLPSEITPIMVAYFGSKFLDCVDITETKSYCSSIEPKSFALCHSAFFFLADMDVCKALLAKSVSSCSSVLNDGESTITSRKYVDEHKCMVYGMASLSTYSSTVSSVGGG